MPASEFTRIKVEIGDIVLAVESGSEDAGFAIGDAHRAFLSDGQPHASFAVQYGSLPDLNCAQEVFDSGGPWSLWRKQGRWHFVIPSTATSSQTRQVAIVEPDFGRGDIYMRIGANHRMARPYPLEYPLEELLFMGLLSQGRGALLHACAVSQNGHGFVFAGTSGAGKSTMADLWKNHEGVTILSDDRVIVREMGGRFWAYGTPWHGNVKLCAPQGVPVDRIFFLCHGEGNNAVPVKAPRALATLFARSFPTYWDPEGLAFTLGFLSKVSQEVPCHELAFLPDRSVIDFVCTMGEA